MTLTINNFLKQPSPWNPPNTQLIPLVDEMSNRGLIPLLYRIDITELANDADQRLGKDLGCTNVFDGTAAVAKVTVVSTDAKDTATGVGCQSVAIFGIADGGAYAVEILPLSGAVAATTDTEWIRVIKMRVNACGSEKDAAGILTMHEDGGVVSTYLTIPVGGYVSRDSTFWVASGYKCKVGYYNTEYVEPTSATAVDLDAGVNSHFQAESGSMTYEFEGTVQYSTLPLSTPTHEIPPLVVNGDAGSAYWMIHAQTVNTGANVTAQHTAVYIVWEAS